MSEYLDLRRGATATRLNGLHSRLGNAERVAKDHACVYVTGSFGRGEASSHSDLDVFIVGRTLPHDRSRPSLTRLNEICLKAELIQATREMGIPEFSQDGAYLTHHTVDQLVNALGDPHDDASNTFTARLLLLLESKALLGKEVYAEIIDQVIAEYWDEFADHKTDFVPGFLANDILRLWRTFCVNYEARTAKEPEDKKAKRKLKNYKLKHSRLLTCYSALAYLLSVLAARNTVSPDDARTMVALSPTERLQTIVQEFGSDRALVDKLLSAYERFLRNTDVSEGDAVARFMDGPTSRQYLIEANEFGDLVAQLLRVTGTETRLHRLLLV